MKYGQRLGKYSVPEWHSHNILYDDLKHQIKELTAAPATFSKRGYESLVDFFQSEIENTNLFVHCKLGEIEYRFQQCDLLVRDLSHSPEDGRLFRQLSTEVQKLNLEIRNLSRFIGAQYTGFRKLLKKYRRHAPPEELNIKNRDLVCVDQLLMSRNSFARLDLTLQFLELSVFYSTLRTKQFGELVSSSRNIHHYHNGTADYCEDECVRKLANFDVEMLTVLASDVYRFWVHPDNLVELKVLLLQNMDLVGPSEKEDEEHESTSVMYMDTGDLQSAQELGEPAQVRQVEINGGSLRSHPVLLVPAGGLRHTAAVELSDEQFQSLKAGKYDDPCITAASPSTVNVGAQLALGWVSSQLAQPVTSLKVHRTRFKSEGDNVWASIDSLASITDPENSSQFPYSVLELRIKRDTSWVDKLRKSHLLHPVSASFSLYAWALLRTYPQKVIARPGWFDLLDSGTDIRREPSEIGSNHNLSRAGGLTSRKSVASLQLYGNGGNEHRRHRTLGDDDGYDDDDDEALEDDNNSENNVQQYRYWNEFDDGDEFGDQGGFFEEIDEELRRARIAANLARPVYQLGESMRRKFNNWFDPNRRSNTTSGSDDFDTRSGDSMDSFTTETSSLMRHQRNRRYSPRVASRRNRSSYGSTTQGTEDHAEYESEVIRRKNDQGLSLITFLCFCLSLGMVALVFTILITEDILLLPSGLRASLIIFLIIALALALLGYVAYNFRSNQGWTSQVIVHIVLLTVVCFGVGGVANIAVPQL